MAGMFSDLSWIPGMTSLIHKFSGRPTGTSELGAYLSDPKGEYLSSHQTSDTVILAVDASESSERAFHHYINKVHRPENKLMLVHSFELPHFHHGLTIAGIEIGPSQAALWDVSDCPVEMIHDTLQDYMKIVEEHRKEARQLKDKFEEKMKGKEVSHSFRLLETRHHAGPTLCGLAEKERAKLIVLGSRGVGVIRETILGSTSSYNVPVLVVKRPQDFYSRLFPIKDEEPRMKWLERYLANEARLPELRR